MGATITSKLNISPGGMPPVIKVGQYDDDFSIVFNMYAVNPVTWTLASGTTAKVRGTKTDGTGYSADCSINTSNKTVTVSGNKQMTAAHGACIYEIVFYSSSKELSSANFILLVERAALDVDTIPSESRIAEIQEIGEKADQIIAAYRNLQFDSTPTAGSTKAVTSQGIKAAIDALNEINVTDPNSDGNIVMTYS